MAARKKSAAAKSANKKPTVPERIFALASPRSLGGVSLFDAHDQVNAGTVGNFYSEQDLLNRSVAQLRNAGFDILQVTPITINIAGSRETYERAFGTKILAEERPTLKSLAEDDTATYLESAGAGESAPPGFVRTSGTSFENVLEGIALERPVYFFAPSSFAPTKAYWHLRVPGDISLACNADRVHRSGITGKGVKVAMVDSGHYKHPFFINRGYRVAPVVLGPAAANPLADESGHGTGESANIFATAPDVDLMPVKINFVNSTGAFNAAVALKPDIITCSWGSSVQSGPLGAANTALAAAIAAAVASGIIVIFSAGNGHWGFPGQHPDVISAGGVYMNPDETLRASDYASGFMSNIYPNRRVPDLSGLVGMRPKAIYIMLPVEPNDDIDSKTWNAGGLQGGTHPNGDETLKTDGWGAFSGTSAAAPQLAGVAALIKQACSKLTPQQVRNIMMKTARDVTAGKSHPNTNQAPNVGGNSAVVGPDTATGNGLVDAYKAVLSAKLACLTPIGPITVGPPILPPVLPPVTPPITPVSPIVGPITPVQPILPITPITPITPIQPITPPITPPIVPPVIPPPPPLASAASQAQGATGLTQEDVEALTEMVANDEIDLDM